MFHEDARQGASLDYLHSLIARVSFDALSLRPLTLGLRLEEYRRVTSYTWIRLISREVGALMASTATNDSMIATLIGSSQSCAGWIQSEPIF